MTEKKTNICLNMIVKNETKVLDRLFRSVADYIDYYVIVDTGSTDGTQDFIRAWMDKAGVEGEVHDREWVNFGVNRQQALELVVAAGKCDWVLFIDADEELGVSDPEFYKKLEPGISYNLEKHHSGLRYTVPHLINIREATWEWQGPVHNYLVSTGGKDQRQTHFDAWIICHAGEGAKSHGVTQEEKYLRDAALLEEDLRQNPDSTRSQFYLAQSYKHAGYYDKAYNAYLKRAAMEGWNEERFVAQLEVGRVARILGKPEDEVTWALLDAYDLRPRRAEPMHELAAYFRQKKKWGRAYIFSRMGCQIPRPGDSLFVMQPVYDWMLLDEYSIACYWVGYYEESKTACESILKRVEEGLVIDDESLKRIHKNLAFANAKFESVSHV